MTIKSKAQVFFLLMACSWSRSVSAQPSSPELSWVRNDGNKRVVVFIHGFLGNARSSWYNKETDKYWPDLLKQDIPDTDIATWEYPTDIIGKKSISPDHVADSLNRRLSAEGILDRSEVVFVAHSLGGVVVRAAILRHDRVLEKTKLILFFSSPGFGSLRASVGALLLPNPIFPYLRRHGRYLERQIETWDTRNIRNYLESLCFFETNPTESLVNYPDALVLCEDHGRIPGTHSSIVKPSSNKSDSHIELLGALRSLSASTTTPCEGPVNVSALQISTNSSNARVVSGDSELDSDDWTSVELSYNIEISEDRRQVNLRVQWFAQERDSDRSPGDSRIASEKVTTLFSLGDECKNSRIARIEGIVQRKAVEEYYRGRLRGFLSFPNTGSMSSIRVQVDARGRSDHQVQALEAVLSGFSVIVDREK